MGAVQSGVSSVGDKDTESDYVLISNHIEETLSFEPSQSYLVAFSINRQTSPRFRHRQLNDTVVNDAFKVMSSLQERGAIPRNNANLVQASIEGELCTLAGMKKAFQAEAKKVGENGAFFFHFSGHGIRVSNDQFGLAPSDFDYTEETYVTASVLSQWLREASCRAKYVVFTIDCCYAGGLAEALTRGTGRLAPYPGLYVLASCTANEVSVIVGTLGNSIFCYFLSHVIRQVKFSPGQLPIKAVYERCKKLSTALSSLLLSYDRTAGVQWKTMQPEFAHSTLSQSVLELSGEGRDQPDAAVSRFSYATELYDKTGRGAIPLDDKCLAWLEMTYIESDSSLAVLKEEGVLGMEQCLMDTVICCMLRSVASIQQACDPATVASPNVFITAYMHVVAAIDIMQCGAKFREREFALGLAYYLDSLLHSGLNTLALRHLYKRLLDNLKHKMAALQSRGEDMTDSGEQLVSHRIILVATTVTVCMLAFLPNRK